jgi:hypothetical protein
MTTNDDTRPSQLRARVEALGHKLVTADLEEGRTGLYILNPQTDELVIVDTGNQETAEREVETWCADSEDIERAQAAARRASERGHDPETVEDVRDDTAQVLAMRRSGPANEWLEDDFNCPPVADKYERFLSLLVVAGLKDRFEAMNVLRANSVEAAVSYLEESDLTPEVKAAQTARDETDNEHDDECDHCGGLGKKTTNHGRHTEAMVILENVLYTIPLIRNSVNDRPVLAAVGLIQEALQRIDSLLIGLELRPEGGADGAS